MLSRYDKNKTSDKLNRPGFTLVVIIITLTIIIILSLIMYTNSTGNKNNLIETEKNTEKDIEKINVQIDDYNEMINKQLERTDRLESDGSE